VDEREFWLTVRRALLLIVSAIDKKYSSKREPGA
jgi:hypothetical protein